MSKLIIFVVVILKIDLAVLNTCNRIGLQWRTYQFNGLAFFKVEFFIYKLFKDQFNMILKFHVCERLSEHVLITLYIYSNFDVQLISDFSFFITLIIDIYALFNLVIWGASKAYCTACKRFVAYMSLRKKQKTHSYKWNEFFKCPWRLEVFNRYNLLFCIVTGVVN